jgi:hypothetical protein
MRRVVRGYERVKRNDQKSFQEERPAVLEVCRCSTPLLHDVHVVIRRVHSSISTLEVPWNLPIECRAPWIFRLSSG